MAFSTPCHPAGSVLPVVSVLDFVSSLRCGCSLPALPTSMLFSRLTVPTSAYVPLPRLLSCLFLLRRSPYLGAWSDSPPSHSYSSALLCCFISYQRVFFESRCAMRRDVRPLSCPVGHAPCSRRSVSCSAVCRLASIASSRSVSDSSTSAPCAATRRNSRPSISGSSYMPVGSLSAFRPVFEPP